MLHFIIYVIIIVMLDLLLVTIIGALSGVLISLCVFKLEKKKGIPYLGITEVATALIFLFLYVSYDSLIDVLFLWAISSLLILIFVYDLKHFIIPNKAIYPAIIITAFYLALTQDLSLIISHLLSAALAFLFFFTIYYATKERGMGFGDVRYAFFMGLFLGHPQILVGLFFSFLLGAIIGLGLIFAGKKGRKSHLPFAPFLIIGTFIAYFYTSEIIHFYLTLYV